MVNAGAIKLQRYRTTKQAVFARKLCPSGTEPLTVPPKVTQAQLASAIGCKKAFVQKLEAGERTPGLALAAKLKELGVADPEDWVRPAEAADEREAA